MVIVQFFCRAAPIQFIWYGGTFIALEAIQGVVKIDVSSVDEFH